MSGSIDPWEAQMDHEFEKIMKMTDDEVLAAARAEGIDIEAFGERMREQVRLFMERRGLK